MPRRLKPICLLSAVFLILSFPPFDLGWLTWAALIPWLFAIEKASPRGAFFSSYLVGLLFFAGTIWWVGSVTIVGTILLVAYLALFFGAWGWAAHRIGRNLGTGNPALGAGGLKFALALAAAWSLLEFLRSILLTGFGWNLLAYTQWHWINLIQLADTTGAYGISFLVVLGNVALYGAMRRSFKPLIATALLLLLFLVRGFLVSPAIGSAPVALFKVAVVQGNIPQEEKWDGSFVEEIWKRYETLTFEAAKERPHLILWPETAVPGYLEDPAVSERLGRLARTVQIPLLVGAPYSRSDPRSGADRVMNSAVWVDSDGTIRERYDKLHLVPFGEYVPLGPLLSWLRRFVLMGDFSPGDRLTVFRPGRGNPSPSEVAPFSVLICFEDIFPSLSRRFIQEGAQWLVVITNDAWFGQSAASLQHLQASVFRAVENRVWVARAANTGWSGFVDPVGRVQRRSSIQRWSGQVPLFQPGVAVASVYTKALPFQALYPRWGDWFQLICLGLILWAFFPSRKPV